MSGTMRGGSGSEGEKEEKTIELNSKFEEVESLGDICYVISPGGDIELISAGKSVDAGDSAFPIITTDEILKLAEMLRTDTREGEEENEKGIKNLNEIAVFLGDVSGRYEQYLTLGEAFHASGTRKIAISAVELPKEAIDEISAFFDLPLILKKKEWNKGVLEAEGIIEDYNVNTRLSINVWNAEKCKQVGTEKKVVKTRVVIREEEYEEREEEVEVPIYECPEGKVIT